MKRMLAAICAALMLAVPALADTVVFENLHYGAEAYEMHLNNETNTIVFNGETYSLDDDEYGDHTEKDMNMADETDGADPERRTHLNELQLKINEALKKLSTKHREVVVLHDVKGLNHTEISALLGISEGTLRSRLHYAHKELQGLLAEYLS